MIRYGAIAEVTPASARAVAIGVFDGVHSGHQEIIRCAAQSAARSGCPSMVITFDPNPLEILRPELKTTSLSSRGQRARLIERLGVDELLEIAFTHEFSQVDWETFCRMLTGPPLNARTIAVGRNFRFGRGGDGTAKMLREYGQGCDVEVQIPTLITSPDGKPISSTRIRRLIGQGDVDEAALLLGRPHCVTGHVVHGDGRGAGMGIPTANVDVSDRVAIPGRGVYAGHVRVGERWWAAAVNVGLAPTFRTASDVRIEAFLLDYSGEEVYGESMTVAFTRRLRNERRFATPEALVAQIAQDIAAAQRAASGAPEPLC